MEINQNPENVITDVCRARSSASLHTATSLNLHGDHRGQQLTLVQKLIKTCGDKHKGKTELLFFLPPQSMQMVSYRQWHRAGKATSNTIIG